MLRGWREWSGTDWVINTCGALFLGNLIGLSIIGIIHLVKGL